MTIIITVSCKEGIILFADRKITKKISGKWVPQKPRDKLIRFDRVACSYHGLAETKNGSTMSKAIEAIGSNSENVDTIAKKVFNFLKEEYLPFKCPESGVHIAGFNDRSQPQIYHIFHNKQVGEVKIELHNVEHYDKNGTHFKKKRQNYFALFNGVNSAVNIMQRENQLNYEKLMFIEVLEEIKKQLGVTCNNEPYSYVCGCGLKYITIPKLSKFVGEITTIEQNKERIPLSDNMPVDDEGYKQYQENIINRFPPSGSMVNFDSK